jgi:hypothetical protein
VLHPDLLGELVDGGVDHRGRFGRFVLSESISKSGLICR